MDLALRLFGVPRLDDAGTTVVLGRRKAMALLAYLAVTGSRHHREALAALLWPESGPEAAYSALRNILWILRQSPVGALIQADRSTIELTDGREDLGLTVDVRRFRALAAECPGGGHGSASVCPECAPRLEEAIAIQSAGFMDGFVISGSAGFDDWQLAEGEALRRELAEALDRLVGYCMMRGDWPAAVRHARRWVGVDRLSEGAHVALMKALSRQGKRSEALASYAECERILREELDLEPGEATRAVAEEIRFSNTRRSEGEGRPPGNLPAALEPILGREDEAAEIRSRLVDGPCRLLTIVGLGGSGKTHLALHVGRDMLDAFPDGVFVARLDSITDPDYAIADLAGVLGVAEPRRAAREPLAELVERVGDRRMLIILDGASRHAVPAPLVASLLEGAGGLRILATSREPLHMRREAVLPLHGLEVPGLDVARDSVGEYAAVRLLRNAAHRAGGESAGHEADLAEIARLVEGLPLGLEMAAAWSRVLPWQEIAARIAESPSFLTQTGRDAPSRHESLLAVYEHARESLTEEGRTALCRLSVFEGGFTARAAEAVGGSSPAALAMLANRCLVRRIGADRYRIHPLIRQFSVQRLEAQADEQPAILDAHTTFFLQGLRDAFSELQGPKQSAAVKRLEADAADIRAAWLRAAECGRVDLLQEAAPGLFFYYDMRSHMTEAEILLRETIDRLERRGDLESVAGGFAMVAFGWFLMFSVSDEVERWVLRGLKTLDERRPPAMQHALADVIATYTGMAPAAADGGLRVLRSIETYREAGDRWGEGLALGALCYAQHRADPKAGIDTALRSLRIRREIGDRWGEALILDTLAQFAELDGDLALAKVRFRQSQELHERLGPDLYSVVDMLLNRARIAGMQGSLDEGEGLVNEAVERARRMGIRLLIGRALREEGRLAMRRGDLAAAREALEEAHGLLVGRPWRSDAASCARLLGHVASEMGDPATARGWYQEAEALDPGSTGEAGTAPPADDR